jgi:hypothetical protein
MITNLGENKARLRLKSGLLPTRGDKVTKSKDRWAIEYGNPEDWENYDMEGLKELKNASRGRAGSRRS